VPAAAVIPAPIAYIKVVAVKELVVGSQSHARGSIPVGGYSRVLDTASVRFQSSGALHRVSEARTHVTLKKLECSK
jgi:hypothetical protein